MVVRLSAGDVRKGKLSAVSLDIIVRNVIRFTLDLVISAA